MIIIRESKDFGYSLEEIDFRKDEEGNDTEIYQFGLALKVFEKSFTILLEYDINKEMLVSMCIQQQENLEREEMNLAYTYVMMLKEEFKSHMRYMFKLH